MSLTHKIHTPELYGPMTTQPQNVNAMKRIAMQTANLRKLGSASVSVISNTYGNYIFT